MPDRVILTIPSFPRCPTCSAEAHDAGCAIQPGRIDGWFVQATNKTPISTNGLHLLVAALRNFYEVMRRGVFDDSDGEGHLLYPYENPMHSRTLLTWRTEHGKWI